jgi:hypothetical protein
LPAAALPVGLGCERDEVAAVLCRRGDHNIAALVEDRFLGPGVALPVWLHGIRSAPVGGESGNELLRRRRGRRIFRSKTAEAGPGLEL